MDLAEDHGGYWSNDEGFTIPVIRHIDDLAGRATARAFYRDSLGRTLRIERRRRRVVAAPRLALGGLRRSGPAAFAGLAFGVPDAPRPRADAARGVWALVPATSS